MPYGHGLRLVSGRFNWCGVGGVLKPATSWPARVALWCSSVGSSRFFRAVIFALAGTSKMPYRRFLGRNAVGGTVWGVWGSWCWAFWPVPPISGSPS